MLHTQRNASGRNNIKIFGFKKIKFFKNNRTTYTYLHNYVFDHQLKEKPIVI